jgi:uncharacterized protein (DUF952 family)
MAGLDPGEHIFHLATARDWTAAERSGAYRTSTLGRSLAEEGFIHASRAAQVAGVAAAFYGEADEPLVLLEIDPGLVGCEIRLEIPPGGDAAFPHLYGPLEVSAVVRVTPYAVTSAG